MTLFKPMCASVVALAAAAAGPGIHAQTSALETQPGTINYVEGEASVGGRPIGTEAVGQLTLGPNQELTTATGRVEVLLTPGVFLRVDDNSAIRMISSDLADTEVAVDRGRALIEATDIHKENDILIDQDGARIRLLKNGLYDFDAAQSQMRVFEGEAEVAPPSGKSIKVKGEHEVTLMPNGTLQADKFDTRNDEDEFFRWSALRSGYLSEATADAARTYVEGGPAWLGTGWYWDPWFSSYTFIPGDGILYSPFGWGFYSPYAIYRSPYYYYGRFGQPHHFNDFHYPDGHGVVPPGRFHGGGFRSAGAARAPRGGGAPRTGAPRNGRPTSARPPGSGRRR